MKEKWFKMLKDVLRKPLPGVEAQLRLSPPVRSVFEKKKNAKKSAVLILLYFKNRKLFTAFIKRAEYEGVHSGQISLPGGMFKTIDITLRNTALRETMEETGINRKEIELIGKLTPLYIPVSNNIVSPFIGYYKNVPRFNPDSREVNYIIEAEINELLSIENKKNKLMKIGEVDIDIPYFDINGDHIWGATAMIMSEFLEIVRKIKFEEV